MPQSKAQGIIVYRCPGPPVIYTDAISAAEATARLCRSIEKDRWIELHRSNDQIVNLDTESVRRTGKAVKVWLKVIYPMAKPLPTDTTKTYRSTKELTIFNYVNRSLANIQTLRYASADATGIVVDRSLTNEATAQYLEFAPESSEEKILKLVCSAHIK